MAFLVFEGLDGSGKSTLIAGIKNRLEATGQKVVVTREPGGTPLGEELRKLLLVTGGEVPTPRCELLLYQAIRAQHVETLIRPALKDQKWVLCDRFTASSVAFQSGARGLQRPDVDWLNRFSTDDLQSDLTILLDLQVNEAMNRLNARYKDKEDEGLDRFEREKRDFHERVRSSYLEQAKKSGRWLILDSTEKPEQLLEKAMQHIGSLGWLK